MTIRHHFLGRGKKSAPIADPTHCILMADRPHVARLTSVRPGRIELDFATSLHIGAQVEIHHPQSGALAAQVIGQTGRRLALAINGADKRLSYALHALKGAVAA